MERDCDANALTDEECWSRLASVSVARLALTEAAMPVIVPVCHRVVGQDVVFGIGDRRLLRAGLACDVVCVEADADTTDGRWTVCGVGTLEIVTGRRSATELAAVVESLWEGGDPSHVGRVRLGQITGALAARASTLSRA